MTDLFRSDPFCFEITVEEPNEQFDVLRDMNDMAFLTSQLPDKFSALSLPSTIPQADLQRAQYVPDMVDPEQLLEIRSKAKLAPRQFQRLLEISLLSTIPKSSRSTHRITKKGNTAGEDDRKYYFWRLLLKERLFIKNKDLLVQLGEEERVGKLEEIMPGVIEEYETRMEQFSRRVQKYGLSDIVIGFRDGWRKQGSAVPKKRKVVESDEEDEEEAEDSAVEKKRKLEKGKEKKRTGPGAGARSKRVVQTTSDYSEEEGEQYTLHE
jgi:histone acetyltransferase 1